MLTRQHPRNFFRQIVFVGFVGWLALAPAGAVILLGTADPSANTTAPTGPLANSGWQYQGTFGGFLGTPIAPNFFITAAHIGGGPGATFTYQGVNYNLVQGFYDPFTDLVIWQVDGTFPSFAPLYTSGGETGQRLVVFGRGTQRGAEVLKNGTPRGWLWGAGDGVQRWGENVVASIVSGGPLNDYVYATFDATGSANEAHLSVGDSAGAVFIQDGATWKLAAINYAVDGPIYTTNTGGGAFDGALYDARDFYYRNDDNTYSLIAGPSAVPTGFYSSRIFSRLAWIYSVIDPSGDANGNGISNLVDYARSLNAPAPLGLGAPTALREPGALSIIYRRLVMAGAPQYVVQKSVDAQSWTTVAASESLVAVTGNVQTIKAQVILSETRAFLRVLISPPAP